MSNIFLKIIDKQIPSQKIYEDDFVYSFLDINPKSKGHCLVVPKKHYDNIEQMQSFELTNYFTGLQNTINVLKEKYNFSEYKLCQNNGIKAGQEVMHLHFHIIPYY